jgi:hypothetical protein
MSQRKVRCIKKNIDKKQKIDRAIIYVKNQKQHHAAGKVNQTLELMKSGPEIQLPDNPFQRVSPN